MQEIIGEMWDFWNQGHWICILTSGHIKRNQEATMGGGCALEAKIKFPALPRQLGKKNTKIRKSRPSFSRISKHNFSH